MFIPINMTCTTKMMFLYCYVDILIMGKILNQLTHTASLSAPKMDIYNLNYKYLLCMNISTFVKEIYICICISFYRSKCILVNLKDIFVPKRKSQRPQLNQIVISHIKKNFVKRACPICQKGPKEILIVFNLLPVRLFSSSTNSSINN